MAATTQKALLQKILEQLEKLNENVLKMNENVSEMNGNLQKLAGKNFDEDGSYRIIDYMEQERQRQLDIKRALEDDY